MKPLDRSGLKRWLPLALGVLFTVFLTIWCAWNDRILLSGVTETPVGRLDNGWRYEEGNAAVQLPCRLDGESDTLRLVHELSGVTWEKEDVFVFRTRYDSIRVWADGRLVYESVHEKRCAVGSQYHVVSANSFEGASLLRLELTRYGTDGDWQLSSVLLDHPDSVWLHLIRFYFPAIVFCVFSLLFTLLLTFVSVFMVFERTPGAAAVLSLAAFTFLSGLWILLDSKITTLSGGNYALTYYFSYCVFYLMMVPFLIHIRLILESRNRFLQYLPWAFAVNAAVCMGLHGAGLYPIHKTTAVLHILLLVSILCSGWELFHSWVRRKRRSVTFFGILLLLIAGVVSLALYYTGNLPATNQAALYSWAFLILILCMTMDTVFSFGRFYKQRQYMELYQQLAMQDSMTLLQNRNAYEIHIKKLAARPPRKLTMILFDVDNLKTINDVHGHQAGDQVIYLSAMCIREIFESAGNCFRIGGDEYCVILASSSADVTERLERLERLLKERLAKTAATTISYGWAEREFADGERNAMDKLMEMKAEADNNLYEQKRERKVGRD